MRALAASGPRFLAQNVVDRDWDEPVFEHTAFFEPGGVRVAVIGQAYPYTPIANPARFTPEWSFGLRADELAARVAAARAEGARLVVLLSHNGLALDRALAARVPGLDVILAAHTHDLTPEPIRQGRTLIVASGSHGAFLTRLDVTPGADGIAAFTHRLIPVLARDIAPEPAMASLVAELRAPHAAELARVVGRSERALWRRGMLNGTMDEVILAALRREHDAEIALSPGFRWGTALPAGSDITAELVWEHTAISYPETWRRVMSGAALRALLEDVADNLFHPDPLARQGGDMVRAAGIGFTLDAAAPRGQRVTWLRLADGSPVEAGKGYAVAGWASVAEPAEGRPVWEAVFDELARGPVAPSPNPLIRLA
jgi:sulfur-oxidizing protein SoxB